VPSGTFPLVGEAEELGALGFLQIIDPKLSYLVQPGPGVQRNDGNPVGGLSCPTPGTLALRDDRRDELGIIHAIVNNYLVGGRRFSSVFTESNAMIIFNALLAPGSRVTRLLSLPWNLAFPPAVRYRYSLRFQLGRIAVVPVVWTDFRGR
jgi:hypothetical protein